MPHRKKSRLGRPKKNSHQKKQPKHKIDSNNSNPSAGKKYIHGQDAMEMHSYGNYTEDGNSRNDQGLSVPEVNNTETSTSLMIPIKSEPDDFEYYFETLPVNTQKNLNPLSEKGSNPASRRTSTCTCSCRDHNEAEERNDAFRMKYLNHLKTSLKNTIDGLEDLGAEVVTWMVLPTEDNCSQIFHLGTGRGVEFINTKPAIDAELHSFLKNSTEERSCEDPKVTDSITKEDQESQTEGTREELIDRCLHIIDKAYRGAVSKDQVFPYQMLKLRQNPWFFLSGFPEELLPLKHPSEYETPGLKKIILSQYKIKFRILDKKLQEAYYKKPPCTSTVKSSLIQKINPSVNNMEVVSDVPNDFLHSPTESTKAHSKPNESRPVKKKGVSQSRNTKGLDPTNGISVIDVQNDSSSTLGEFQKISTLEVENDTSSTLGEVQSGKNSTIDMESSNIHLDVCASTIGGRVQNETLSVHIKEEPMDDTDLSCVKREALDDTVHDEENPTKRQKLTLLNCLSVSEN